MNKKEERIVVRVTEEQNERIIQECNNRGISKSAFARQKMFQPERGVIYTSEFRECLENINNLVLTLKETATGAELKVVDKLIAEVGKEWLFLNK